MEQSNALKMSAGLALTWLVVVYSNQAIALTYDYSLFTRVEYSDNLAQIAPDNIGPTEQESGNLYNGGIDFSMATESNSTLVSSIAGSYAKNYYSINELSPDSTKSLNAVFLYQPSTNNFRLSVIDTLQQVAIDRTSAQTVNNIRDVNTISASPSYFVNVSPTVQLASDYRFTKIDDREGFNSRKSDSVTLGILRQSSTILNSSLNVRKQVIKFVDNNQEFEQEEAFIGVQRDEGNTLFNVEIGRQRIRNALVDEAEFVPQNAARLSVTRQINSFSNLNLFYRYGFGDALNADLNNPLTGVSTNDQVAFIDGVVEERQFNITYNYNKRDLLISVRGGGRSIENNDTVTGNLATTDEDRYFFSVDFNNRFASNGGSSAFGYGVGYQYQESRFNINETDNKSGQVTLQLNYFSSPQLQYIFEVSSRDASGTNVRNNFEEKRVLFGIRYTPRGGQQR